MRTMVVATVMAAFAAIPPVAAQGVHGVGAGQNTLSAARELYASARYDEALTVLDRIAAGEGADRRSVEQYRSLCLLALGRAAEAEHAIAALVTADPTFRPGESDAAPRVRATFSDVRRRLLPEIIRARYVQAKALYDRKDWEPAVVQFRGVLSLIDDPDTGGRLGDLRELAIGFMELSARAAAPPPEPAPVPASGAPVPPAAPVEPVRAPEPQAGKVYTVEDEEVIHPVVVKQDIPQVPGGIVSMVKPRGIIEVVIDEQGRPVSIAIRSPLHPAYDSMLLVAARDWKYRPAMFDGRPVKFRKLIQVSVQR